MSEYLLHSLQGLLAFILVLAPLVFAHELGHFLVAKFLGIGVPVFSLGFGPRLFGLRRGGTDYRVSAVPLGGYVRLAGDESDENRTGAPEEFLSRPKWQRFLVFVAGASFNVALAFLVLWGLFAVYGKDEVQSPDSYAWVENVPPGTAAARAGVERGDVLLTLGGRDLKGRDNFEEAYNREVVLSPHARKPVVVERNGERLTLTLEIEADPTQGHGRDPGWELSWGGDETPVIAEVQPGDRGEQAGVRAGDRVLAAAGREPISEREFRRLLEASPEQPLPLKIDRSGQQLELTVVPRDEGGKGRIGTFIGTPTVHRDLGLLQAAHESLRVNLSNSLLLFEVLKRLVTHEVSLRTVSGPIGIAQVARRALIASPGAFVWLLGFFSLQLGILNLLPIPVLDGGHVLILAVEGILRRDLSDKVKERVMQVGFVFLLVFMGIVIYLDLDKVLGWSPSS